jgi:hypothetical protein
MFEFVVTRLVLEATFCIGLSLAGRAISRRDAPKKPTMVPAQTCQTVNGEGMTQQVSVTLNVSPKQLNVNSSVMGLPFELLYWPGKAASFLKKQGPFIAVGITGICYLLLRQCCVQCNNYCVSTNSWRAWIDHGVHSDDDQFLAQTADDMMKDLIIEIQRRYTTMQDPTDFFGPIAAFTQGLNAEINQVTRFIYWLTVLKKMHLTALFPIAPACCESLEKTKKSLEHLKAVFLQWVTDYKIAHNKNNYDIEQECSANMDENKGEL